MELLKWACLAPNTSLPACNPEQAFRSITGYCNNLDHSLWGAASTRQLRYVEAQYADGKDVPRGGWESSRYLRQAMVIMIGVLFCKKTASFF